MEASRFIFCMVLGKKNKVKKVFHPKKCMNAACQLAGSLKRHRYAGGGSLLLMLVGQKTRMLREDGVRKDTRDDHE